MPVPDEDMPLPDEDATLAHHLGAAAQAVGAQGKLTRLVAGRLKKDVLEIRLGTGLAPEAALALAEQMVVGCVPPLAVVALPDGGHAVRAVMGTGFGGMNPAVVTLTVTAADGAGSTVLVRGAAKEGLIKQRGGQRAVEGIVSRWLAADPTAGPETDLPD
ncbi:hypothetical protein EJC51_13450 [Streptomyces aquilus]|uniref:Uncharacterized protein n=1 Tax=Streptomyces aquilus TaxID=2548456 RepID=A0A3S9HY82_9ACTN|nr:hypothetical protein [Streptomyces aquilus]AZP17033.1 hypothetical protein EJC51_13450 [Streptomyces aquilus]